MLICMPLSTRRVNRSMEVVRVITLQHTLLTVEVCSVRSPRSRAQGARSLTLITSPVFCFVRTIQTLCYLFESESFKAKEMPVLHAALAPRTGRH